MKINLKSIFLNLFLALAVTTTYASNSLAEQEEECCAGKENKECKEETCSEEMAKKSMKDGENMAKKTMEDGKAMLDKTVANPLDVKSGIQDSINGAKQGLANKANSAVNSAVESVVPKVPVVPGVPSVPGL